jgi:hypothetical protein
MFEKNRRRQLWLTWEQQTLAVIPVIITNKLSRQAGIFLLGTTKVHLRSSTGFFIVSNVWSKK